MVFLRCATRLGPRSGSEHLTRLQPKHQNETKHHALTYCLESTCDFANAQREAPPPPSKHVCVRTACCVALSGRRLCKFAATECPSTDAKLGAQGAGSGMGLNLEGKSLGLECVLTQTLCKLLEPAIAKPNISSKCG